MRFENAKVFNFEGAFRGMRNPKESWSLSDSLPINANGTWLTDDEKKKEYFLQYGVNFNIGEKDLKLAQRLIKAGTEHRKFMRQIFVSVDITAPLYWWSEFDTYKVGTVANSTSTMHKIMSKPFTEDLFEMEGMRGYKKMIEQKPNEICEDTEEWKVFPLNEDYIVSNQGRVKRKTITTTHGRVWKERILTNTLTSDNYLKVGIKIDGKQKDRRVHDLVAITFIPNPNNLKEVNHKNGNKLDNRVENLEWCTRSENQKHAVDNNLQPRYRVNTYKGKLSKEERNEVIMLFNETDISKRELAKKFDVSDTTINSILSNKYNYGEGYTNEYEEFLKTLNTLNELRDEYLITGDKEVWKTVIEILPRNWLQTRTCTFNYENLLGMCSKGQRRYHKLNCWSGIDNPELPNFISFARDLPYAQELIFIDELEK